MSQQESLTEFKQVFPSNSEALAIALQLRTLVFEVLGNVEENFVGGKKVRLILYSRGGPSNVLCGIQEGKNDTCFLYVHHLPVLNHPRLFYSGKGKHAKRITFTEQSDINREDITWLLHQVEENSPF